MNLAAQTLQTGEHLQVSNQEVSSVLAVYYYYWIEILRHICFGEWNLTRLAVNSAPAIGVLFVPGAPRPHRYSLMPAQ